MTLALLRRVKVVKLFPLLVTSVRATDDVMEFTWVTEVLPIDEFDIRRTLFRDAAIDDAPECTCMSLPLSSMMAFDALSSA